MGVNVGHVWPDPLNAGVQPAETAAETAASVGFLAPEAPGPKPPRRSPMPEAVIVDAIRTPIGRAFKGSLKDVRADELAAVPLQGADRAQPGRRLLRDRRRDDGLRLRASASRATTSGATPRCWPASTITCRRLHRQPLLRLLAADAAHGLPRHQGRRGRPVHRRGRRVGLARRPGRRHGRRGQEPEARRLRGLALRRLHPDGADGRERRRALQRLARGRRTSGRSISQNRAVDARELGPLRQEIVR